MRSPGRAAPSQTPALTAMRRSLQSRRPGRRGAVRQLRARARQNAPDIEADHPPVADGQEVRPRRAAVQPEVAERALHVRSVAGVLDVEEHGTARARPRPAPAPARARAPRSRARGGGGHLGGQRSRLGIWDRGAGGARGRPPGRRPPAPAGGGARRGALAALRVGRLHRARGGLGLPARAPARGLGTHPWLHGSPGAGPARGEELVTHALGRRATAVVSRAPEDRDDRSAGCLRGGAGEPGAGRRAAVTSMVGGSRTPIAIGRRSGSGVTTGAMIAHAAP